tara:strand:- start:765 stop:959 length:195 start_codon:yes stop_codon:yes gene_type:complete
MTINNDEEFKDLSPLEERVAKLSIKYQTDLMSMSYKSVIKIISQEDWADLSSFIKNGCRERIVH